MKMQLISDPSSAECTIGKLSIDGVFFCYTLEDTVRKIKIPGVTAIPAGTYEVIINNSGKFGKPMPLLLDVPNFKGIRIHIGNTAKDTEGCILVGYEKGLGAIYKSKDAYNDLYERLKKAMNESEKVTIEIVRS
jgi:hypothetical protein